MVHKIRKCIFIKIISLLALCIIYACKDQVNKIDLSEQRQYVYSVTHDQIENILIYSQDGDECYSIERKETKQGAYYINPQFRSIILCDLLLYIDVTFWYLSIDLGFFWGSWFCMGIKSPTQTQWGI